MIPKHARILVVDDEPDVLFALKLLLKSEVREVVTERNPELQLPLQRRVARGAACAEGSLVERPAIAEKAHQCEGWSLPGRHPNEVARAVGAGKSSWGSSCRRSQLGDGAHGRTSAQS